MLVSSPSFGEARLGVREHLVDLGVFALGDRAVQKLLEGRGRPAKVSVLLEQIRLVMRGARRAEKTEQRRIDRRSRVEIPARRRGRRGFPTRASGQREAESERGAAAQDPHQRTPQLW